jgi:hypothetical protein
MAGVGVMAAPGQDSPDGVGWVSWGGMAIVLAAAAMLSFSALRDLAVHVQISVWLAWALPVSVDAGAAVSCRIWLARRAPEDAGRFARGMTWGLLALTIAGNAASQGMTAEHIVPPWPVAVAVGAVPPLVVGCVIHLMVLVGRAPVMRTVTVSVEPAAAQPAVVEPAVVTRTSPPVPVTHPQVSLSKTAAPRDVDRDAPRDETPDQRSKRLARERAKRSRDRKAQAVKAQEHGLRAVRTAGA